MLMRPSTVVLCGAYSVGKERIFKSIAVELDCKLWTSAARVKVWHCLQDRYIGQDGERQESSQGAGGGYEGGGLGWSQSGTGQGWSSIQPYIGDQTHWMDSQQRGGPRGQSG